MGFKDQTGSRAELVYVVCPVCGRNRYIQPRGKERIRWDLWDPETGTLIQIREQGGKLPASEQPASAKKKRGGAWALGFPVRETLTWEQAKELYPDQVEGIREQLRRLQVLLD